ncbi:MAG TPA: hypothetical protein DDW76_17565 [Cyanobacteria bacterium UBA11369]|nr:hypothetical protein [Cyanobacteria bacterium UBA11371]HBE32561.1 hypothetical protein [Cyanobacteria bacterium UBA11368]HBE50552.1 hypothetical protein [Cyanobacteria bacterium UBA11369]
MTNWIKISYERNQYVIDLDRVSAFVSEQNGTLKFWLPDSGFPIVLNPQGNPEAHQKVLAYIEQVRGQIFDDYWIEINYERNTYLVNLKCISSFASEANGRITFWLPDGAIAIIINPQSNKEDYQKVINYIQRATGHSLP